MIPAAQRSVPAGRDPAIFDVQVLEKPKGQFEVSMKACQFGDPGYICSGEADGIALESYKVGEFQT